MKDQGQTEPQKRVWVVDDDETALLMAHEVLHHEGFEVETFSDPTLALEAATRRPPDIIVLDVMMPGMDGFTLCSRLRSHPKGRDLPILMATSLDDADSINRAYEAGATNFTAKPINWKIETHRLRYLLRAAAVDRALRAKEHEARQAKEDWERTFNSISDVVTLLSPDLKIIRANHAVVRAVNRPLPAILGAHCYEVFQRADAPCESCPVLDSIRTGTASFAERPYRAPAADCLVSAAPTVDRDGRLQHVVHVARDLTEQKQLEAEYRQAQKMEAVGRLAGGVAHDFNNILQVIVSYSELLGADEGLNDRQRNRARNIFQSAKRATALAGQLLTFSRKSGPGNDKQPLDLNQVIGDFQRMLEHMLPKSVAIYSQLAEELPPVHASADQLHQVLMNLAVNAADAMRDGGTLALETRTVQLEADHNRRLHEIEPGHYVMLAVSDTGHGMNKEVMGHIFEPFFTTKQVGEGTGLGLSVVYGIIKDHRGRITCESEPGLGTTFKIFLPVHRASAVVPVVPAEPSTEARAGTETILVVEDDEPVRSLLVDFLGQLNYRVVVAEDGEQALNLYRDGSGCIRLILLDVGMPGMGGWECLRRLRALDPDVKVAITTGYGGPELHAQAFAQGAAAFIRKPFEWQTLSSTMRALLDSGTPAVLPEVAAVRPAELTASLV